MVYECEILQLTRPNELNHAIFGAINQSEHGEERRSNVFPKKASTQLSVLNMSSAAVNTGGTFAAP